MMMITKMELIEGELGRFAMKRGKEPTEMYNRLKTLVNQIRNYGSTRWMDHDVVRLMLRSFTILDPNLVNLVRVNLVKGKCALGPFLSILVIECQHKWLCVKLCQMVNEVQINTKDFQKSLQKQNNWCKHGPKHSCKSYEIIDWFNSKKSLHIYYAN
jgi:hypothetical protein